MLHKKQTYATIIISILALGWVGVVLWHFFKSFPLVNLPEILLNGGLLLILVIGFTALGKRIFRVLQISFDSFAQECCFSFGLGTGLVIFLMIGLASLGLLYEILIVLLLLGLFGFVYQDARTLCITAYNAWTQFISNHIPLTDTFFLLLLGCAGLCTFVASATPPYFYDALVYHLAVPQKYLLLHGFHELPRHPFSNYPSNLSMLFLVGMSFSGGMQAKLLSWVFAPMTSLAVYSYVKPRWGRRMGISAAAILLCVPGILILSILTSVDLGLMFFSFLSLSALQHWFVSRQKSWFVLAGIFCGLAVGTKYTAIVAVFFGLEILLFWHEYREQKHPFFAILTTLCGFGLLVLLCLSPWLIKNTVYTGNPLYPFFNALFGSHGSEYVDYAGYMARDQSFFRDYVLKDTSYGEILWLTLKAPWTVTMKVVGVTAGKIGILFLFFLPGIFLLPRVERSIKYLLLFSGCVFWAWFCFLPQVLRYVFPILPPLSIVTAHIIWHIPASSRARAIIVTGVTGILLYHFAFLFGVTNVLKPFTYLFANQSQEEFLVTHSVNYYPVIQYINRETDPQSKILFVAESRGYYCERDYELYTVITGIDHSQLLLRTLIIESQTAAEVGEKLKQRGFTHILLNLSEMHRLTQRTDLLDAYFNFHTDLERERLKTFLSPQYLRPLFSANQVFLYEIL